MISIDTPEPYIGSYEVAKARIDCIMMEKRAFDYEIKRLRKLGKYDEKTHFKSLKGAVIGTDPVYIGYSETAINTGKYPYINVFKKEFDVVIYKMIKSGEVEKIMDAYQD